MQETWHIVHIKPYPPHTISHLKHPAFSVNCSNMQWHPCLVLGLSCWQWHHRSIIPSSCQNVHMPKIASKFRSRNLISTEPLWRTIPRKKYEHTKKLIKYLDSWKLHLLVFTRTWSSMALNKHLLVSEKWYGYWDIDTSPFVHSQWKNRECKGNTMLRLQALLQAQSKSYSRVN